MRRAFPERPIAAVGAVVFYDHQVLLVRRKVDPYAGRWSIPGGAIELGERAREALVREVREECGVDVEPLVVVDVYDNIVEDGGTVKYHYVVIDYLSRYVSGTPRAGSDVDQSRWIAISDLDRYEMTPLALSAIERGLGMMEEYEG
jgi:mutator protein MutT